MKKPLAYLVILAMLGGCASGASKITPAYVSPMQYKDYSCDQITAEMQRLSGRANQLAGRLDKAEENDKMIMGAGLILFWPALFALGGTKEQEAEYSRLKGEYDAIHQMAIQKNCGVSTTDKK